jgi:3-oxoacyl-[acyl-carrier-protein] synthase-1
VITAPPLTVLGVGLMTGVGSTAEIGCAAIRCGINNFRQTRFAGADGEWLVGSAAELSEPCHGVDRLAKLATAAVVECVAAVAGVPAQIPVLLCVAEPERPGRLQHLTQLLLEDIEHEIGARLHPESRIIEQGRVGGAVALLDARRLLADGHQQVIVAGVDSLLVDATLAAYNETDRLLTAECSNGFIPGEAAGAVLLAAWQETVPASLVLRGLGFAREPAPFDSGRPLRADGLVQAIQAALAEAGVTIRDCDYRIADLNGEQYRFKEAALAITRLLRDRKSGFSVWHPSDCIGEVGAATLPAMLAMLYFGARKDYLPGRTFLGHLGNDDDKRAAFVAQALTPQTLSLQGAAETDFTLRRRSVN